MAFVKRFELLFFTVSALILGISFCAPLHASETFPVFATTIQTLSQNKSNAAGTSLSGKSLGSISTLGLIQSQEFVQAVGRHQNKLHSFSNGLGKNESFFGEQGDDAIEGSIGSVMDYLGKQVGLNNAAESFLPNIWSTGFERNGRVGSANGFDTYEYTISGLVAGADTKLGHNWNVGIAGGYSRSDSVFQSLGSTGTAVDAYHAALYVNFERANTTIDSNISFTQFENSSRRSLLGGANAMAEAKGKGYQLAWNVSAMKHQVFDQYQITPMVGFTSANLHNGGMKEDGGGAYNLNSTATSRYSLKPTFGIDIAREYQIGERTILTPEVYGIYRYEMLGTHKTVNNSLSSFETISLATDATRLSRHSAQFGSSISLNIGNRLTGKAQFHTDIQPSSHSYGASFRFNYAL